MEINEAGELEEKADGLGLFTAQSKLSDFALADFALSGQFDQ